VPIEDARDKHAAAACQGHLLGAAIVGVSGALDETARFETVNGGGDAALVRSMRRLTVAKTAWTDRSPGNASLTLKPSKAWIEGASARTGIDRISDTQNGRRKSATV